MDYMREINAFYEWLDTNPISDSARHLWHALMHVANRAGWITEFTVAISVLEAKTGMSRSAVYRARNELKTCGRIQFKNRTGNLCSEYQLNPIAFQYDTQSGTQTEHKAKREPNTKRNTNATHRGIIKGTTYPTDTPYPKTNTKTNTSCSFAAFWSAYPRKEGKGKAEDAFGKLIVTDDLLATMLKSIDAAKQSDQWRKDGGQYIPHPSTWLNQRRWEDEVTVAPGSQKPKVGDTDVYGREWNGYHWTNPVSKQVSGK